MAVAITTDLGETVTKVVISDQSDDCVTFTRSESSGIIGVTMYGSDMAICQEDWHFAANALNDLFGTP